MEKQFSVQDILPVLPSEHTILGNSTEASFTRLSSIFDASQGSLTWLSSTQREKQLLLEKTAASIIICDKAIIPTEALTRNKCLILVDDPRLAFVRIGNHLFPRTVPYGVHATATIHLSAQVHPKTYIGPYTYVGAGSTIDEGTVIYGHCHLCDDAGIAIGKNVVIHAGCTIGVDGFGYTLTEASQYELFPQIGGVIIEDNVEIHSNVNVDRGTLGDTIIGAGTKIDKFCHIGHNVVIGNHCIVTAQCMIGGSACIGDYVWLAPCVCIRDGGIHIGSHAFVGMAAVVTKDIAENSRMMGFPARPIEEYQKLLAAWRSTVH